MVNEIKRTVWYAWFALTLLALLLGGMVGRAGASQGGSFPGGATPPAWRGETGTAVAPGGMPRVNYAPRSSSTPRVNYVPRSSSTPPPLIQQPVVVIEPDNPDENPLPAEAWKEWPVLPAAISAEMRQIYQEGLRNGTDPRAFSVIGDCQSQPEFFMGVFDTDPFSLQLLPAYLRETARQYTGSFGRSSPTVQDGITAGAVLWGEWANKYQDGQACQAGETPLACELRLNNPSIVLIHVGTHWEGRNERYLTMIIETIKEHGAVPVMVTKADNREKDERVNLQSVRVAQELGIPVWNFWASVQNTPNYGLVTGSDKDLNEQALEIRRYSALQVLDMIWRAVK
ncbi:MAG TPA: hypothetical protein VLH85_08485 [Levilinea sp.]|nr:hypothetical protein [Levilinea sp.]